MNIHSITELNGLKIQWGVADQPNNADKEITFPIIFVTNTPSVTYSAGNTNNQREHWDYPVNIHGVSSTKFILNGRSNFSGARFYWQAIGY